MTLDFEKAQEYIDGKAKELEELKKVYKEQTLKEMQTQFVNELDKKLPLELLKIRPSVEGKVIGCFLNDITLYGEYANVITYKEFLTIDGRLFFNLGKKLYDKGVKDIDEITLKDYLGQLSENERMCYEAYDIINIVKDLQKTNIENIESYIDDIVKWNMVNRLFLRGFNILDNLDDIVNMDSSTLYDWMDYQLNDTYIKSATSSVQPVDLASNNREFIKKANEGLERGIQLNRNYQFNYEIGGIHSGNIMLHTAFSGIGKTSSLIPLIILPLLEAGQRVILLINEQSGDAWRGMMLTSIIGNNYIDTETYHAKRVLRNKMIFGGFTDEELEALNRASDWLDKYKNQLILYPLEDYTVSTLTKIIKKLHRENEETTYILDTWKPSDESESNAHQIFTEESKELFKLVKPKDMGGMGLRFIATAQLNNNYLDDRYLKATSLAKAKAILEVVGTFTQMRRARPSELDKEDKKNYIHPFVYTKTGEKREVELRPTSTYTILFISKNRYGRDGIQLLFESNLDYNYWHCVGYCVVKDTY